MFGTDINFHAEVGPLANIVDKGYEDLIVPCPDNALGVGHLISVLGTTLVERTNFYIDADGNSVPPIPTIVRNHAEKINAESIVRTNLGHALRMHLGKLVKNYKPSLGVITKEIKGKLNLGFMRR